MTTPPLPVDAARGDARHRDVGAAVLAAVPQRRAPWTTRIFWRFVLFIAQYPAGLALIKRLRGS